jgi:hypothetical protein
MYFYALHPDVLGFLTLKDAVKLRLANKECLEACNLMKWSDKNTTVKDLEKWKKCFSCSTALNYRPTLYAHEYIVLGDFVNSNGLNHIFNDGVVQLKSLVLPNIHTTYFVKNPWPLYTSACSSLKHLLIPLDANTLQCILNIPLLCDSLLKLEFKEYSKIRDQDILKFSFDLKGSLQIKNVFWERFSNLKEFDCSKTSLSHAILDGSVVGNGNLQILRVNKTYFNTQSVEALRAKKRGIKIIYLTSRQGGEEEEEEGGEGEGEGEGEVKRGKSEEGEGEKGSEEENEV